MTDNQETATEQREEIIDIWKSITSDTSSVWEFIAVSILTSIICFVLFKILMFI